MKVARRARRGAASRCCSLGAGVRPAGLGDVKQISLVDEPGQTEGGDRAVGEVGVREPRAAATRPGSTSTSTAPGSRARSRRRSRASWVRRCAWCAAARTRSPARASCSSSRRARRRRRSTRSRRRSGSSPSCRRPTRASRRRRPKLAHSEHLDRASPPSASAPPPNGAEVAPPGAEPAPTGTSARCGGSRSTRATAARTPARSAPSSCARRAWCWRSRASCARELVGRGFEVVMTRDQRRVPAAGRAHRRGEPARRRPVPVGARERREEPQARRRRDVPARHALRPADGAGRGARERHQRPAALRPAHAARVAQAREQRTLRGAVREPGAELADPPAAQGLRARPSTSA